MIIAYINICQRFCSDEQGVVNLGAAANSLMRRELEERLSKELTFDGQKHMKYFQTTGLPRARAAVSAFFQRHFSEGRDVKADEVRGELSSEAFWRGHG